MHMAVASCWSCIVDGREGVLHVTRRDVPQGEERDTSDEEWEAAYNALDPLEQIGFGNRRREVTPVGATLLRDVFAAADEIHENAMSGMDGNTLMDEDTRMEVAVDGGGDASMSRCREASGDPVDNMEERYGGETAHEGSLWSPGQNLACLIHELGLLRHNLQRGINPIFARLGLHTWMPYWLSTVHSINSM